jgi:signal peptidase II
MMLASLLLFSALLLVVLDQWTKAWAVARLPRGEAATFGIITFRTVLNRRVHGKSKRGARTMFALWLAELVFILSILHLGVFSLGGKAAAAGLGVALGGAASNTVDCLRRDGVIDFVDLGFWPVFNLADVAIVSGVCIAMLYL